MPLTRIRRTQWPFAPRRPSHPRRPSRCPRPCSSQPGLGAVGAALLAPLAKLKAILLLLPKVKLLASGTILVSLAAYASLWGWIRRRVHRAAARA